MQTETTAEILARLWAVANAMFARMSAALGAATALAQRERLQRDEVSAIRAWLAPLEAMVRRVVLFEAAKLARTPAPLAAPKPQRQTIKRAAARVTSLRLWPKAAWSPARIRQLGPPLLVRDIYRERARVAAALHLAQVRFMRAPIAVRLARRIDAIARVLAKPHVAARRLARKLRLTPRLALRLATRAMPRTALYDDPSYWASARYAYSACFSYDSS